ncbi:hypothetical protein AVEN_42292-1 [Araneus ventricosus]|uniref:Uncharacterized protein n=1 Tax=Araneus ventricosus TaxID=182803 RepID=A0A4Y2J5G1_ARAVE|nr:hypothetical protein AVEN_42292-1 [Araneus ventricosus]
MLGILHPVSPIHTTTLNIYRRNRGNKLEFGKSHALSASRETKIYYSLPLLICSGWKISGVIWSNDRKNATENIGSRNTGTLAPCALNATIPHTVPLNVKLWGIFAGQFYTGRAFISISLK